MEDVRAGFFVDGVEVNARYRQVHKAEIKARNHEFYLRRKARNESR